jgi:hypothetical protein
VSLAEDARALVERTCKVQGLPERVTDGVALTRVAALVLAIKNAESAPRGAPDRSTFAATSPQGGRRGSS